MNFATYQKAAFKTALPASQNPAYMLLGLGNEAGEVQGKYKKVLRGDATLEGTLPLLKKEIGDVLWYLACLSEVLGVSLNEIAIDNLNKLESRAARGQIQGNGDER